MSGTSAQRRGRPGHLSSDRCRFAQGLGQSAATTPSHNPGLGLRKSGQSLAGAPPHYQPSSMFSSDHLQIMMKTLGCRFQTHFDAPLPRLDGRKRNL